MWTGTLRDDIQLVRCAVYGIDMAVVENVGSMPKQGVSTTFKFGRAAGCLDGVLQALYCPMTYLTPAQWKTKMKMTGKAKDYPRQWCSQRWPTVNDFEAKREGPGAPTLRAWLWPGWRCTPSSGRGRNQRPRSAPSGGW